MAGIMKAVKVIDTKNRVTIPRNWGVSGEYVCFEITRSGNLLLRKITKETEVDKETSDNDLITKEITLERK